MNPIMQPGKSASVQAAMENMLAGASPSILGRREPSDEEGDERRDHSQNVCGNNDRTALNLPPFPAVHEFFFFGVTVG